MAIYDYKDRADKRLEKIKKSKTISEVNKKVLYKFLDQYDVSDARHEIFLTHIYNFLEESNDVKADMNNRDKINKIFDKFRKRYGKAHYSTIVNVTKRFIRWVNEGELPKGFADVQNVSQKKVKRDLKRDDMISWDDGLELMKHNNSIQFKALFFTQLDGGFRPSEFVELNYGDVDTKREFYAVHVKDGKTGKRDVILYKSVPYLQKWLNEHPTKKDSDPLWIREDKLPDISRYDYFAMRKRLKYLADKIDFKKPVDFYNLRHSACFNAKKDNLPVELAVRKFGHSSDYFINTYARLDTDDDIDRTKDHYRVDEENAPKDKVNMTCDVCGNINPPKSEVCSKCNRPLSISKALELYDENEKLKTEIGQMKEMLVQLWKERKV